MFKQTDIDLGKVLVGTSKTVAPASWVSDLNKKDQEVGLTIWCDFDADHPSIRRVRLDVRLCVGRLDQVTFHTHLKIPNRRSTMPLFRLDLFPGAIHVNPIRTDDPDSGRVFQERETHVHSILDDELTGRLNFARAATREIADFSDAWAYFCDRMVISNPEDLPTPTPQGILL